MGICEAEGDPAFGIGPWYATPGYPRRLAMSRMRSTEGRFHFEVESAGTNGAKVTSVHAAHVRRTIHL